MQIEEYSFAAQDGGYRYGFNTQEKEDEIAQGMYSAEYWKYDSRIGRRWNLDPKPVTAISPYACFGNNPLFFTDHLGDTLNGLTNQSAQRGLELIHSSFRGEEMSDLRDLFQLDESGNTFKSISESDFKEAIKGLSDDAQSLAYGYYQMVNDDKNHIFEVLKPDEKLSDIGSSVLGDEYSSTTDIVQKSGGGRNVTNIQSGMVNFPISEAFPVFGQC